ncbi:MAG: ParB/RepB/Spo0J family partition protein [Candidatus Bathyarchaeia archaeon]|jgi:ParB-like chromosome segregation protein Spo0J
MGAEFSTPDQKLNNFLKTVTNYLEYNSDGSPKILCMSDTIYVKVSPDLLSKRLPEFSMCLAKFSEAGGKWTNNRDCQFIFTRAKEQLLDLKTSDLVSGPQIRVSRNPEKLQHLKESVEDRLKRNLPPFTHKAITRPSQKFPGKHEVLDGNGRWQIAQEKGLTLPAIDREMSDAEAKEIVYLSGDQDDYTDFERGKWLSEMMQDYPELYPTQQVLADKLGEKQRRIQQLIDLYNQVSCESLDEETRRRVKDMPQSVLEPVLRVPDEIKPDVLKFVAEKKTNRAENRGILLAIKNNMETTSSPKQAFEDAKQEFEAKQADTKLEPAPDGEVLKRAQEGSAEKLEDFKARKAKLYKLYPEGMVNSAFAALGNLSDLKITAFLCEKVGELWNKLPETEQNSLFKLPDQENNDAN